jgi:anti-anti-sigma factor
VRPKGATFEIRESVDPDGLIGLRLFGELDLEVSDVLARRLDALKTSGEPVRLDLSRLDFIDSSGVRAILLNVRDARRDGWRLEVARQFSGQVERTIKILGADAVLWPTVDPGP